MSSESQPNINDAVAARKAVRLVWDEVRRYGGSAVEIELSEQRVAYHFTSRDGRRGEGSVNPRYAAAMSNALMEAERMTLGADSVDIVGTGSGAFRLSVARQAAPTVAVVNNVIPIIKPSASPAKLEIDKSEIDLNTARLASVLIVEDSPTFSRVLARFLERQGFEVTVCGNGQEAVEKLSGKFIPDLIVSDLHMPHMNGDEFAVAVRQIAALKATPLILLTSDRAVETELRALEAGADLFLAKSEDPRLIAGYIKRFLARREKTTSTADGTKINAQQADGTEAA